MSEAAEVCMGKEEGERQREQCLSCRRGTRGTGVSASSLDCLFPGERFLSLARTHLQVYCTGVVRGLILK